MKRLTRLTEPPRPKVHWDYLCEEMQWLSADFAQERRWKRGVARKVDKFYYQECSYLFEILGISILIMYAVYVLAGFCWCVIRWCEWWCDTTRSWGRKKKRPRETSTLKSEELPPLSQRKSGLSGAALRRYRRFTETKQTKHSASRFSCGKGSWPVFVFVVEKKNALYFSDNKYWRLWHV